MFRTPVKFIIGLLLLGYSFLFSEVVIDLQVFNTNSDVIYVGDLDVLNLGNSPNLFQFTMQNTGPDVARLKLRISVRLNGQEFAWAETGPFNLPVGASYVITQNQLSTGSILISDVDGTPQRVKVKNSDFQPDVVSRLEDAVKSSGKLPAGEYAVDMIAIILDRNDNEVRVVQDVNPDNNVFIISNPTVLELLFPGRPVSEDNIQVIATLFPFLQWESDANRFNVFIFQKYPEDQTVQDVLSHPPILHLENYPDKRLQYPSDTSPLFPEGTRVVGPVRLLEFGEIYYWYVQAIIDRPSGAYDLLNSDVYRFRIADVNEGQLTGQQILNYLERILGTQYGSVLQQLISEGFYPTGNGYYQGSPVDPAQLLQILRQTSQQPPRIEQVQVY